MSTLEPSEIWRSPLNRLTNHPAILRTVAYFEFHSFYIFRVFSLRFVSGGVFLRRPFLLPEIHFAAIPQSFFTSTKAIENGNYPLKLHFEPFTLLTASVVALNCAKKLKKFFKPVKKCPV